MAIAGFYWAVFALFAAPAALLELQHGSGLFGGGGAAKGRAAAAAAARGGAEYVRFRDNYLLVFALMMAGDWLQGPYVYHLYEHYGFSVRDIGRLFIAGFGSSAVLGTVVGALADKHGRKRAALLYVAAYALSCATKHSRRYGALLVGRLLGGVATSLLFSVFEAWAVAAHVGRGFDESLLADLFTRAVMLGNGVMAIASGLAGSWLVQGLSLGPVAPFDAAIVVLLVGGVIIARTWEENRGARGGESLARQFKEAAATIARDERVALLGVMQALFEAAMYAFVFLWTPALNPHAYVPAAARSAVVLGSGSSGGIGGGNIGSGGGIGGLPLLAMPPGSSSGGGARGLLSAGTGGGGGAADSSGAALPHGLIFAIFMTASMVGTALAGRMMATWRLEAVLRGVFWAGAALLAVPAAYHTRVADRAAAADVLEAGEPQYLHRLAQHRGAAAAAAAAGIGGGGGGAGGPLAGNVSSLWLSPSPGSSSGGSSAAPPASLAAAAAVADLDAGGRVQLLAFCGFEVLIGLFWPAMMALRARYVPEEQRATVINAFRVPLNLFVCGILWKVSDFPLGAMFGLCSAFLVAAALAQARLAAITAGAPGGGGGGGMGSPMAGGAGRDRSSPRKADRGTL